MLVLHDVGYIVAGLLVADAVRYVVQRAWALTVKATCESIAGDAEWRRQEGAPVFDIAGNEVDMCEGGQTTSPHDETPLGEVWGDAVETAEDGELVESHGVLTTSTRRGEVVAVVNTALGPLTLSLVKSSAWRGVDDKGVDGEVAGSLRLAAARLRDELEPCVDCGGVSGVHTKDCGEVAPMLDMGCAAMCDAGTVGIKQ